MALSLDIQRTLAFLVLCDIVGLMLSTILTKKSGRFLVCSPYFREWNLRSKEETSWNWNYLFLFLSTKIADNKSDFVVVVVVETNSILELYMVS